jgi:hypothetical membrane protein
MAIPILIFLVALLAGVLLAARWLPDLGSAAICSLAFWATCGLGGLAIALVAVHLYELVRQLSAANAEAIGNARADIVATAIVDMLRDAGPILGLSAVVYLLPPALGHKP